ncbi:hypothetical protein IV102_02490 [bacterium]|nr:hypothetical protein [bacterium]
MATQTETEGHLLVNTIKAVLEKRATPEQLEAVMLSSRQGLDQQIQDFQATVAGLPAEMREKITTLTDAAEEVFGFMDTALQEVGQFLQQGDVNLLYNAGSVVRRAADQLNYIFNEMRNFVLAVSGPTSIPNLNLMLRAYEVFTPDKDAKGERLKEFVQSERFMALQSLDDLEKSEPTPELSYLKEVWDAHLRCMNRLFAAIDKGDKPGVDKEMENARTTFTRLFERIPSATMSQRYDGPTDSPQVNLILSLAADVEAQVLHDAPLVEALAVVYESASDTATSLDQILEAGVDSVIVRESIARALQAIEYQQEALNEFSEFFINRTDLVLRSAMFKLEESTLQLTAAMAKLTELADREGKVACIRCSHYNPTNRHNCEKCNTPLPNLGQQAGSTFEAAEGGPAPGENAQGPVLTSNLVRLYTAVNGVADGTLDADAFLKEVEWFQAQIDSNSEYEIEEPNWEELDEEERSKEEEAYKALEEVQAMFAQGVAEMNEALEKMRGYVESESRSEIEDALRTMDNGARKIATVGQLSKQSKT